MKPLTLILLLGLMVVILTSGCLTNTPQKKEVPSPVTTIIPVTPATLPPSAVITNTPAQLPVVTPEVIVIAEDVFIPNAEIAAPNLRILKYHEERPEVGRLIISGIAKNEGKTMVPRAEVQIKFYDANKNVIVSSTDATDNFDPGGTWGFTVVYPGPDSGKVKSYKVSIIQVY